MNKTNLSAFRTNNDKWTEKVAYRDKKIANTFYKERERVYEESKRKSQNKIPSKSRVK